MKCIRFLLFLVVGCLPIVCHAQEQYEEGTRKITKHKRQKRNRNYEPDKVQSFSNPSSRKKEHYRIDLLGSFYIDELSKTDIARIPERAQSSIDFYEGLQLAADSLNQAGFVIDVFVHDITDPQKTPQFLISTHVLEESDLIIGLLQTEEMDVLADYAKSKHIHFISALSPSDGGIEENTFFTVLQPTLKSHCESIRQYVATHHNDRRIIVYNRSKTPIDAKAFEYLTKGNEELFQKLSCNKLPTIERMSKAFDSTYPNVIVMPILETAYADSLLNQLKDSFPRYKFVVYGMPSWKYVKWVKKSNAHPNVTVNITTPFYYDTQLPVVKAVNNACIKTYGIKASEMVYRGYDCTLLYAQWLRKYGTGFYNHALSDKTTLLTDYDIRPRWDEDQYPRYYENMSIWLQHYEKGKVETQSLPVDRGY